MHISQTYAHTPHVASARSYWVEVAGIQFSLSATSENNGRRDFTARLSGTGASLAVGHEVSVRRAAERAARIFTL